MDIVITLAAHTARLLAIATIWLLRNLYRHYTVSEQRNGIKNEEKWRKSKKRSLFSTPLLSSSIVISFIVVIIYFIRGWLRLSYHKLTHTYRDRNSQPATKHKCETNKPEIKRTTKTKKFELISSLLNIFNEFFIFHSLTLSLLLWPHRRATPATTSKHLQSILSEAFAFTCEITQGEHQVCVCVVGSTATTPRYFHAIRIATIVYHRPKPSETTDTRNVYRVFGPI